MSDTLKKQAMFVLVLVLLSLGIIAPTFLREQLPEWWPSNPIRLGLDLRGGAYLVLGVQTEEAVKSNLNSIAQAVRSELRRENVEIIRARVSGDDSVEFVLLGERGIEELDRYIRNNYRQLANRQVLRGENRATVSYTLTEQAISEIERNAVIQAIETIRNRVDQYGVTEPTIQRVGQTRIMAQLPDVTDLDSVKETIGSVAQLEFRLVADVNRPEDQVIHLPLREGGQLRVEDEVLMTGDTIERANVDINPQTNETEVLVRFNALGRRTFGRITQDNVGKQLAIVLDGVVQSYPVIREPILGGTAQISGGFTRPEAHQLAVVLRSGALPAPLTFEEQRNVGATLGQDSIEKGVFSMLVGSALVVAFILLYYRKSGLLAVACLSMNVCFLLALLSILGATLTLPGIAGLLLTVGMAVDANVIIFERIREELSAGSTGRAAIEGGFLKAHWTILDANVTTLLVGIVLYAFGTGPIKGFAVTLSLGVLTSMFTALFVAKVGFGLLRLQSGGKLSI